MTAATGEKPDAVFTRGPVMRHVAVMSATGAVGLTAIFAVDLLSLLYISWLGQVNVTAGVGFATTVFFLSTSVNIGMMIAVSAVVARALGSGDRARARRLGGSGVLLMTLASALVAIAMMAWMGPLLTLLGATGEAHQVAWRFMAIAMPSNVLMALGLAFSAVLRAVGDARRAMYVTLAGGIGTAAIDPLLIFGLGLGPDGAAWIVLFVARDGIVAMFAAQGETARLVVFFCTVLAGSWIFHGALFVANAAFNNLGFPLLATGFNWGKATLGTVPFVAAGAHLGGAEGALLGQAVGAVVFGVAGVIVAYRCVDRLSADPAAMAQAGGTT